MQEYICVRIYTLMFIIIFIIVYYMKYAIYRHINIYPYIYYIQTCYKYKFSLLNINIDI